MTSSSIVSCFALGVSLTVVAVACSSSDDKAGSSSGSPASGDGGGSDGASSSDDAGGSSADGGGGGEAKDTCDGLCKASSFTGGEATDFGGGVVECVCTGTSATGGIQKAACEAYCAPLGVGADKSFVSMNETTNDKCVCDGT